MKLKSKCESRAIELSLDVIQLTSV